MKRENGNTGKDEVAHGVVNIGWSVVPSMVQKVGLGEALDD